MSAPVRDPSERRRPDDDPDATLASVVLEPDASELTRLRTVVADWAPMVPHGDPGDPGDLVDEVVLVASELATVGLEQCDGEHPLVVVLRRTHSVVVVELTCHLSEKASLLHLASQEEEGTPHLVQELDLDLLQHLADRVVAEVRGRTITLSGRFHLDRLAEG